MRLALHTISYAGVWNGQARLPLVEILDRAVTLGYEGVMLTAKRPQCSPLDLDPAGRVALRSELERRRLAVPVMAGYTDFGAGPEHPDIPLGEAQVSYVTELARLAHDLGSGLLRIFTGFERPGVPFSAQWQACVEAVRECATRAAAHGVVIGIQNHHDLAVHVESALDFLRDVDHPNCRLCFDAWSAAQQGGDLRSVARQVAPFTVHTTVADYARRPRFSYQPDVIGYRREADLLRAVPMGEGFIDYEAFFAGLREGGYPEDGWVAYEMCSPLGGGGGLENLDRHAGQFVDWMRTRGFA
ncbi:MAG: sugar phosphate isomerase/epimerase family protein [Candidatus Dormiibacterota bacterium]